ncbi:unnamed protein product (macronuclear) [Paramecium tetraurelia]|uniref:Uncharacterized protein n=1 Tax=Paramecium tetraurelia TaxID=5888 RepID=A0BHU8_PARTE|nr:uncharacterized protein GSPATT00029151001 [Paramecium tetraurelia]CAK58115.1 unnamed protein product [Paramecium tetraurelia]|eukprot:XP_001425513.1 hypothetical protein (macronuclear) [Paramecium tetraurelia strain d4-2]
MMVPQFKHFLKHNEIFKSDIINSKSKTDEYSVKNQRCQCCNEVKFKKYYNLKDQTLLSLQNICFKKLQIHYTETNFKMLKQGSCLKMQLQNCYPKPYFRLDVGWGYDQSKQSMDDQRHKTTTIIEYKAQNISQTATLL